MIAVPAEERKLTLLQSGVPPKVLRVIAEVGELEIFGGFLEVRLGYRQPSNERTG